MADMWWLQLRSGRLFPPPIHISFYQITSKESPNCSEIRREKRPPTHRIAFNSFYLFSSRSIIYEANGEALYNSRDWTRLPAAYLSVGSFHSFWLFFARLHSRKRSGGVASMTRDRGYPDWLVLSARLLRSGYHSANIYICFGCVWPVAICSYFRNRRRRITQKITHWNAWGNFVRQDGRCLHMSRLFRCRCSNHFAGPTRSRFLRHLESIFNQEGRTSNWSGTSSIDWKTVTTNEEWYVFKLYCNFGTPSLFNVVSVFCLAVSAGVVMP